MDHLDLAFLCLDCGVDTSENGEYYMVHLHVWLKANPQRSGMLCIGCLEQRLKRRLVPDDFIDAPINSIHATSPRIRSRMA